MAAEGKSTNWGTIADLSTTPVYAGYTAAMLDAGAGANITPGGLVSGTSVTGTMGHFCVFRHDGGTEADWTEPFNFPINGDFTIVINSSGEGLDADTTMDVSVQGSVDGTNYVDLHTDLIDGVQISASTVGKTIAGVYDYDAKGRMPYMRLELTAGTASTAENILIHVIPH